MRNAEQAFGFEPATPPKPCLVIALMLRSTFTSAAPHLFLTVALEEVKVGGVVPISLMKEVRQASKCSDLPTSTQLASDRARILILGCLAPDLS